MEVYLAILGKSAKLNVRYSVFAVKLPNLMTAKCTTPKVDI